MIGVIAFLVCFSLRFGGGAAGNPAAGQAALLTSLAFALVPLLLVSWLTIRVLTARFVLETGRVGVVHALGQKWIDRAEIAGMRMQEGMYQTVEDSSLFWLRQKGFLVVMSATGRKLHLPTGIKADPIFDAWVGGLPVVDRKGERLAASAAASVRDAPVIAPEAVATGIFPYVTLAIMAVLIAVFLFELSDPIGPGDNAARATVATRLVFGALARPLVLDDGQWFRIVTAIFLHQDVAHIVGNGIVLVFAGIYLEKRIGHLWLAALFLVSGIVGSLMSMVVNPAGTVSVGASGAIMGMLVAILVIAFRRRSGSVRIGQQVGVLRILIPALIPSTAQRHIDVGAHIGGAVGGLVLVLLLFLFWSREDPLPGRRRVAAAILIVGLLPLFVGLPSGVASALGVRGDFDISPRQALMHYDRAIAADPLPWAYLNRGIIRFNLGDFGGAADDFAKKNAADPSWPYSAIFIHLARMHLGQSDADEFARNVVHADSAKWPAPVIGLFQDRLTPDQVSAAARTGDAKTQNEQTCEANFYIGEYEAFHSQIDHAKELVDLAARTCPKDFIEYKMAFAEATRLKH